MPELPEVETMRRGVRGVVGARIHDVVRPRCVYRPITIRPTPGRMRRQLVGRRIAAVERAGKRVILRLEGDDRLIFEPRMTGLVLVADPPDTTHLRLRLLLEDSPHAELLFWDRRGLGGVELLSEREFTSRLGPATLGPDALEVDGDCLRERLRDSRREIKVALLDQKAVAGIGNLYASEILFLAGIHPQRRCTTLRRFEWDAVADAIQSVLRKAIRYEGSTLADGTYRNALNQSGSYQNHHRVYDRADDPCPDCKRATIRRIVQAQRSTFFCPSCQSRRRAKPR